MYKTKLGISVGLMGAFVCFLGAILGLEWFFMAIIAYILLREDNEWLRRLSLKVLVILIATAIIGMLIRYVFQDAIYDFINLFTDEEDMLDIKWPSKISSFAVKYLYIASKLLLIFVGFKALKQGHVSVKPVDNLISKNV